MKTNSGSEWNGKRPAGVPPVMFDAAMERIKAREHYWIATVMFEMSDETLAQKEIELKLSQIRTQTIMCMVCAMDWKPGRQGTICVGQPA